MKQVSAWFDEDLLRQLDDYADAHDRGRSAVLREAVTTYLARDGAPAPRNGGSPDLAAVEPRLAEQTFEAPERATRARLRSDEIVRRYGEGYGKFPPTEDELNGWEDEEVWPEE